MEAPLCNQQLDINSATAFTRTGSGFGFSVGTKFNAASSQFSGEKSAKTHNEMNRVNQRMFQNKREFKILFPTTREHYSSGSPSKDDSIDSECLTTAYASARNIETAKFRKLQRDSCVKGSESPTNFRVVLKQSNPDVKK